MCHVWRSHNTATNTLKHSEGDFKSANHNDEYTNLNLQIHTIGFHSLDFQLILLK